MDASSEEPASLSCSESVVRDGEEPMVKEKDDEDGPISISLSPISPPEPAYPPEEVRLSGFSWRAYWKAYVYKFRGKGETIPPRLPIIEIIWSWLGAIIGIGLVAVLHYNVLPPDHLALIVGSFGASAVLIFGAIKSPLAQPRNFVGGHIVSAIVGVSLRWAVQNQSVAVMAGLSVATAIAGMQVTNTVHPPGGATALIACTSAELAWGGYLFVFMPVATGALIMLVVAVVVNNLLPSRTYPLYWW